MPKINQTILNELDIPICSADDQKKITSNIDSWVTNILYFKKVIADSIQKTENLRQSMLTKAFSGRLVEQDSTEEPVSETLARLWIETTKKIQVNKSRKKGGKRNAKSKDAA